MDKVKTQKNKSIKRSFTIYVMIGTVITFVGALIIGHITNILQDNLDKGYYTEYIGGRVLISTGGYEEKYQFIGHLQIVAMLAWIYLCIFMTGRFFYNRNLKTPIEALMRASKKISNNDLDFKLEYSGGNELGQLCRSFEHMRETLFQNNLEMWNSIEDRKLLNSAFSHDLRTPFTVLYGYTEFLRKYAEGEKVSREKIAEIASKMGAQVDRLKNYTQKMTSIQKIEDIIIEPKILKTSEITEVLMQSGNMICDGKVFDLELLAKSETAKLDMEILMTIFENLVSNASRYAKGLVKAKLELCDGKAKLKILDDGKGFSRELIGLAAKPFYREENGNDPVHLGLGLYICDVICRRCGGQLTIGNHENGGMVIAEMFF